MAFNVTLLLFSSDFRAISQNERRAFLSGPGPRLFVIVFTGVRRPRRQNGGVHDSDKLNGWCGKRRRFRFKHVTRIACKRYPASGKHGGRRKRTRPCCFFSENDSPESKTVFDKLHNDRSKITSVCDGFRDRCFCVSVSRPFVARNFRGEAVSFEMLPWIEKVTN